MPPTLSETRTDTSPFPRSDLQPESHDEVVVVAPPPEAHRDRFVDLLRGLSILAVALGHWLVVVPTFEGGRFDGVNALATVPSMHRLTWIFQVMPLFFIVGGYANAISWRRARQKGTAYDGWLRTRLVRLVRPTAVLLIVWTVLGVALRYAGVDSTLVYTLAWLVVVPLWFLAVYVIVVALAPPLHRAHERWGAAVLVGLAAAATVVDFLRIHVGIDGVEYSNFFFVFLFAQQLGFFWVDGRLDRRPWMPWALFTGGVTALWLLTHVGPYPVSLVGVPGERIANNAPPTITLLALGLAQAGLALVVRGPVTRWLERPRVWSGVVVLNLHAMTIHLWHFTALVIASAVVLPLGVVPSHASGSFGWWMVRIAMAALFTIPLVALVAIFGRVERVALMTPAGVVGSEVAESGVVAMRGVATARMIAAALLLSAAFLVITLGGLSVVSAPLGLPVLAIILFGGGLACLGRQPSRTELGASLK